MTARVGIDYLPAVTHWPGVGRYVRELVRALVRLEERPELVLFEAGGEARTIGEPALGLEGYERGVKRRSARVPRRVVEALARRTGLGADRLCGGVDVFHRALPHYPPVATARQTLAVAELPPEGSAEDAQLRAQVRAVDHLLVASRHGEGELRRRYDLPAERVHLVSLGCEHWRRDLPDPPPRPDGPPDLLVLGAVRPERKQDAILAAFERLKAKRAVGRLVVVGGGERSDQERFASKLAFSPARESVEWISEPVEQDLPALVAASGALVHLSTGEETAVTPLEAFSFGVPVVTNPGGPFEEALGDEAVHFDAFRNPRVDVPALASAIERALETADDAEARARREQVAARFTWAGSARRTADVWARIASG